ncbi:Plasmodium exported protein, unknown function [Plasmodium vivax]|nr:Plasmodium exported protein, unknown function [Plasmodium vivax]
MEMLGKYNMKNSLKLVVLLKFLTFMLLIWNPKNDVCGLGKALEMKFKHGRSSNTSFNRLLAKHEYKEELEDLNSGENLVDYETPLNINNEEDVTSTYAYLKKRRPINLFSYKRNYERRYSRKKGLAKLECYCEKKIFDKIDDINKLSEKLHNDKKRLKKEILKKQCKGIIILTSILVIVTILNILFTSEYALIRSCGSTHENTECNGNVFFHTKKEIYHSFEIPNFILFLLLSIIHISVVIYTFMKLVKYKRLKMGREKMNTKDYINFCKEVLI